MIGFLHTAPAHVPVFEALLREIDASVRSRHAVDEGLLADARAAGSVTPRIAERVAGALAALTAQGAAVLVCTCSTIGAAAETAALPPGVVAMRIDRPMAERAVAIGRRIAVVAALPSTLGPTADLLHAAARRAGRSIEIVDVLCADAWSHFERGDTNCYLAAVSAAVERAVARADVVVLAQASMAAAADRTAHLSVPVLSSPRLGVEAALRAYHAAMCEEVT